MPEGQNPVEIYNDAEYLVTTHDTAVNLIAHHPQLATINPQTAAIVKEDHILSDDNAAKVDEFTDVLDGQGANWSVTTPSVYRDSNGQQQQMTWGPGFASHAEGTVVYINKLSGATYDGAGPALRLPLQTSQDDTRLRNQMWVANQGMTATHEDSGKHINVRASALARSRRNTFDGYTFALDNKTEGHGLTIYEKTMTFYEDFGGTHYFSLDVKNTYLRTLFAFVKFFDEDGPLAGHDTYEEISVISAVNVILGIPVPTDPTKLNFQWPTGASRASLVHGGLGTSRWDNDVVWPGVINTGVFQYAIPGLFLLAGSMLDDTSFFKTIQKEKPLQATLLSIGISTVGTEASSTLSMPNIRSILSAFADAIAGILVHAGLAALRRFIYTRLGASVVEESLPGVDIYFSIANRAVDLIELGETTVEVLSSPAAYEVEIRRSLPLQVTVSPDPTHGTATQPAIWPEVADHYECLVQYKGGTFFVQSGALPDSPSSSQVVNFASIPAGGNFQITFSVYSSKNWLAGKWTSGWVKAVLPEGDEDEQSVLYVSGSIQENLIPLTASTVYNYEKRLVYNEASSGHAWQRTEFNLSLDDQSALDNANISDEIRSSFKLNAFTLSSGAAIQVANPGVSWSIKDGAQTFLVNRKTLKNPDDSTYYQIIVDANNAPLETVGALDQPDTGHNLLALGNITINNKAYMLGYSWLASGQNLQQSGVSTTPEQIYAFQNINLLSNPEGALKFPACGFSNQSFIVYDQFGPAPLFNLPLGVEGDLDNSQLTTQIRNLFASFSYTLPDEATVSVAQPGVHWTVSANGSPDYELARLPDAIEVHTYPMTPFSQNNFYLEPTQTEPVQYHLRRITLDSTTPFDMNQPSSWGLFTLQHMDDFAVHPQGYVVGISYQLSKMEIVKLPDEPFPDQDPLPAVMTSGPGTRQGLMDKPSALGIAPDGRILVLEQGNKRVQAFDVNGNPVPCFDGQQITTLDAATYVSDLDKGLATDALRSAFAASGVTLSGNWLVGDGAISYQISSTGDSLLVQKEGANIYTNWTITNGDEIYQLSLTSGGINVSRDGSTAFTLDNSLADALNAGLLTDAIINAFAANKVTLQTTATIAADDVFTLPSTFIKELAAAVVSEDLTARFAERQITLANATVTSNVTVTVRQAGQFWVVRDEGLAQSFKISASKEQSGQLIVLEFIPFASLYDDGSSDTVTYSDIATELKGYIYVLSYGGDGSNLGEYYLDIYEPTGKWLTRNAGVNVAKMVVDMWRNMYALNFGGFAGPNGRTEPTVSAWIPSTPAS